MMKLAKKLTTLLVLVTLSIIDTEAKRPIKLEVFVGDDGTNDDVTASICSVKKPNKCCSTLELNSGWTNDWDKEDHEVWDEDWMGDCAKTSFSSDDHLRVTLSKSGTDDLIVDSLLVHVETHYRTEGDFFCGDFELTDDARSATKECYYSTAKANIEEEMNGSKLEEEETRGGSVGGDTYIIVAPRRGGGFKFGKGRRTG